MACQVSVIITAYNAQEYLAQCLDCIRNQTLKDIQIICVDDGSTDRTPEILDQYAALDSRIIAVHQKNGGAGAARNHGLTYATGEYLSILDADDFYEPDMLETAYRLATENQADIAVFRCDLYREATDTFAPCNYSIHNNLLPQKSPFAATDVQQDVFKLFVGWAWDKLFRRSFVEQYHLRFQEQRTTNDMLFVFSAMLLAQRIVTTQQVLAHHRQAEGTLSVTREKSWMCFYNALTALRSNMQQWGIYSRFEQDFINYCLHFSLWNLNTLKEPTHTLLYNKLREEWFADLGIQDHPQEYFYHRGEYNQYRDIHRYTSAQLKRVQEKRRKQAQSGNVSLRGIRCLQENGIGYTLRNIQHKITGRFHH